MGLWNLVPSALEALVLGTKCFSALNLIDPGNPYSNLQPLTFPLLYIVYALSICTIVAIVNKLEVNYKFTDQ